MRPAWFHSCAGLALKAGALVEVDVDGRRDAGRGGVDGLWGALLEVFFLIGVGFRLLFSSAASEIAMKAWAMRAVKIPGSGTIS